MTITLPNFKSLLSTPSQINNFMPLQSVQLSVTNVSASKTLPAATQYTGQRVTFKITNSGSKGAYLATGATTAIAVASSGTPAPASGNPIAATCDYIAAGAILTQDYAPGTDTIAAICAGTDTTTLEITFGTGQ